MSTVITQVLQGLIAVTLDITLWSARKKLRPEDLAGVVLPPDKLATLGSKRVYDPDSLCIFATLKRQAERACSDMGVRFLGGYAVPESKLDQLFIDLESIQDKYEQAKKSFLSNYDSKLDEWLDDAGEWREIVAKAVEPASAIAGKLTCGFTAYKVGMPEDVKAAASVEKQIGGLADQLIKEVSKVALDAYEESYKGRNEVTRKALRPLTAIQAKLNGLAFIAPEKISGIMENVEAALAAVPKTGPIQGAVLQGLKGTLMEIADIDGYNEAAEKVEAEALAEQVMEVQPEVKPIPQAKAKKPRLPRKPAPEVMPESEPDTAMIPEIQVIPEIMETPQPENWFW